ncbi:MAG: hypothetical protein GY759_24220 [Chloroflexi bacterium]|nr:hypothetical protein [Chloroflexota bacterium]
MFTLPSDRPLIVARRGARAHAPENTLPAFELAIEQGADAIEMDVQFTADGALILMHGLDVDDVSDGDGAIRSHTLEEIRALDAGSWFDETYAGVNVPTLAEALDTLAGRIPLVLELKSFTRKSEEMEEMVWEEIRERDMVDQVTVSSFNPYILRRLREIAPDLRTSFMQATGLPPWFSGSLARRWSRANDILWEVEFGSTQKVAKLKQPLWLMTIDEEESLSQALSWQASALITDDPRWLNGQLALRSEMGL